MFSFSFVLYVINRGNFSANYRENIKIELFVNQTGVKEENSRFNSLDFLGVFEENSFIGKFNKFK